MFANFAIDPRTGFEIDATQGFTEFSAAIRAPMPAPLKQRRPLASANIEIEQNVPFFRAVQSCVIQQYFAFDGQLH